MSDGFSLWIYLSTTPLLWLCLTLVAWGVSDAVSIALKRHPLANPIMFSVLIIGGVLLATGTQYESYFEGAQFVHFLLGPATVAIAVPLVRNIKLVRENLVPLACALLFGSVTAIVSVLLFGRLFGLSDAILASLAPKSITATVGMGVAENIGGIPSLTAVMVIMTGILGAILVTPLMDALRIKDYAARGFSVGLASHGIGTARAFSVDPVAGTFAGIAMGLNALLTALILPFIVGFWGLG
jgi:predicted murein hydrolase (TIGR00659 family)